MVRLVISLFVLMFVVALWLGGSILCLKRGRTLAGLFGLLTPLAAFPVFGVVLMITQGGLLVLLMFMAAVLLPPLVSLVVGLGTSAPSPASHGPGWSG